jgi:hypothetical protein
MRQLWELGHALRLLRARLRVGELSRAPLQVLRIEVSDDVARCDWIARPPDPWDDDLPVQTQAQRASLQALADALALREILFLALPNVRRAELRTFRARQHDVPELIIEGAVAKGADPPRRISSLAMRAMLSGFRFWMEGGVLRALDSPHPSFRYAI